MAASSPDFTFSTIDPSHITPPASIMDEADLQPATICPQDISSASFEAEDVSMRSDSISQAAGHPAPTEDGSGEPPKKKRKSWGQVLPKPTTNLPPRKRAKTEVSLHPTATTIVALAYIIFKHTNNL